MNMQLFKQMTFLLEPTYSKRVLTLVCNSFWQRNDNLKSSSLLPNPLMDSRKTILLKTRTVDFSIKTNNFHQIISQKKAKITIFFF